MSIKSGLVSYGRFAPPGRQNGEDAPERYYNNYMIRYIYHRQKEATLMNFKKTLVFLSLTLVAVSFNVYAVDPSICNSGANVVVHDNGSLKSCELKSNYEANNIQCRERNPVSFYDKGSLESCILSTPTTIGENKCDQFYLISFYPDGNLKSCMKPGNR